MLTILHIESDSTYATIVKNTILSLKKEQIEAEIISVSTLEAALLLLKITQIELILTNLKLDDARGSEIIRRLDQIEHPLPILVCGKEIDEPLANEAIQAGAQDFFDLHNSSPPLLARLIRYSLERTHMIDTLRALSFTDELTHLYNRRGFFTLAQQQREMALRLHKGFHLFLLDVDHFKQINDRYGHPEGDRALRTIAQLLQHCCRRLDLVARIGGDELALLAIHTQESFGEEMKEKIHQTFCAFNETNRLPYVLTLTIGSAFFHPENPSSIDALIAAADQELYLAKIVD